MYVKDVCGAYLYLLKVPPFLSFIILDAVTVAVTIRNKTIKPLLFRYRVPLQDPNG